MNATAPKPSPFKEMMTEWTAIKSMGLNDIRDYLLVRKGFSFSLATIKQYKPLIAIAIEHQDQSTDALEHQNAMLDGALSDAREQIQLLEMQIRELTMQLESPVIQPIIQPVIQPAIQEETQPMHAIQPDVQTPSQAMYDAIQDLKARVSVLENEMVIQPDVQPAIQTAIQDVIQPAIQSAIPQSFEGWTLATCKKGFIRIVKRISGKSVSLYIGKVWSEEKAKTVLAKKGYLVAE